MSERICDNCGEKKNVAGGKTCENGHFICKECVWKGTGGGFFGNGLKTCTLCQKPLR
jgi:hypothetical protein